MKRELKLNVAPSKRRILDMDNNTLLANYALIVYKASSLSSSQRKLVEMVLQTRLNHGSIRDEEVAKEVTDLGQAIKDMVDKEIKEDQLDYIANESISSKS